MLKIFITTSKIKLNSTFFTYFFGSCTFLVNSTTQSEQRQQPNTENRQLSRDNGRTSNTTTSTTVDENSRNAKESLYLWLSETQLNQLLEYNFLDTYRAHAGQGRSLSDLTWDANHSQLYHQSLCYSSDSDLPKHTCCTFQMELGLLQKTTEELHQSLSTYLGRWHKELAKLRTVLRGNLIKKPFFKTNLIFAYKQFIT